VEAFLYSMAKPASLAGGIGVVDIVDRVFDIVVDTVDCISA
jgi:hypothetical protein